MDVFQSSSEPLGMAPPSPIEGPPSGPSELTSSSSVGVLSSLLIGALLLSEDAGRTTILVAVKTFL